MGQRISAPRPDAPRRRASLVRMLIPLDVAHHSGMISLTVSDLMSPTIPR
jgi:hypothetical protein